MRIRRRGAQHIHRKQIRMINGGERSKLNWESWAEACAVAGSVAEGVTVSMDIEQLIYEAGRLHDAASLLNRLSSE